MSDLEQVPIWLPGSARVDRHEARVDRAVQEYDQRLRFGRNEATGDWCIFIKFPPNDEGFPELYPILGFGREVPGPHEALKRLYEADTLRHGARMLDQMNAHNEKLKAASEPEIEAAKDELVLGIESYARNQGQTGYSKSYSKEQTSKRRR